MQKVELVKDILSELMKVMEISPESIEVHEDEFGVLRADVTVDEKNAPLLIGAHGQTLSAFQAILKSLLWKKGIEEKSSVQLDINEYRKKQEDRMVSIAKEKAESVRATGMPQFMPPMAPYMRRLVHLHLAKEEFSDLETESVGEEGERRIQIKKRVSSLTE